MSRQQLIASNAPSSDESEPGFYPLFDTFSLGDPPRIKRGAQAFVRKRSGANNDC
jgi:hypothetical protein